MRLLRRLLCLMGRHLIDQRPLVVPTSFGEWVNGDSGERPCLRGCGYVAKWTWLWVLNRWERLL